MILDAIRSRNTIPIPKSGLFIPVIYKSYYLQFYYTYGYKNHPAYIEKLLFFSP